MKEYRGNLVLIERFKEQDVIVITKKIKTTEDAVWPNGYTTIQYLDIPVSDIEKVISFLRAFV